MPQVLSHAVIPRMVQDLLGPLHRDGGLARQRARNRHRPPHRLVLRLEHLAHEPDPRRLFGGEGPRAHAHVFDPSEVADDPGQARERAEIGRDADVDFFDGEACRCCAEADVGAGGDVDADAVGYAMKNANDGYGCVWRF